MVHQQVRPFVCTHCSLRFKTKAHLNNHSLAHHPEKHKGGNTKADPFTRLWLWIKVLPYSKVVAFTLISFLSIGFLCNERDTYVNLCTQLKFEKVTEQKKTTEILPCSETKAVTYLFHLIFECVTIETLYH